jgi:hypothetical protein
VWRGFLGRFTIAIEPFVVGLFFAALPVGLWLRHQDSAIFVAPIFALASIAFTAYAIVLMVPCTRALIETYSPIYVVDGYVRYRRAGGPPTSEAQYFVAVLSSAGEVLGEWPLREWPRAIGDRETWPVLVEFSPYGGIHKIDGRPTGVLPAEISPLGIGIAKEAERRRASGSR